jgi:hypothetical protein
MVKASQASPPKDTARGRHERISAVGTNFNIVRDAIIRRLWVIATYRGHYRRMCPHVLGWKRGRAQCLFYQFDGTSESGLGPVGSPRNWQRKYFKAAIAKAPKQPIQDDVICRQ